MHTPPDADLCTLALTGDVTFLDTTGLSFLARVRAVSESRGGSVRLSGPTPAVRRLLELVGFDTVFTIE